MLSETNILEQYSAQGFVLGGELYLSLPQAFNLIADCYQNNLAVIGIEGFICEKGMLEPQLDAIADFSSNNSDNWDSYRDICYQSSRNFLHQVHSLKGLVFSFVILSEKEWISSDRESDFVEYQSIG
ncbi:MAG: hypothetical protein GDA43_08500 [Hormoscilla sp. SP5CHS1]|nr:hypothetical protein [Hormoscilla sp. SP12CHS1]MBC6453243.1 hypothetical protein [Hormoscilla sp. SP5CHS1]